MLIVKEYEVILNLSATELYRKIDDIILEKLTNIFQNKCEKNSLIIKILKIIKRSGVYMTKTRLDGSGDVNVQFSAEAIVYNENDILTNCEVTRIEKGNKIICKHPYAIAIIRGSNILQSLTEKQKIIVLVQNVRYLKNKDKIIVVGVPYTISNKFTIYATIPKISNTEDIIILNKKIKEIDEEFKLYEKANKKMVKFFNDLFYPYKKTISLEQLTHQSSKIKVLDFYNFSQQIIKKDTSISKIYIFRHPIIEKNTTNAFEVNEKDFESGIPGKILDTKLFKIEIVEENITSVLLKLLNDYLSFIRMINELTEIYSENEIESHKNLWDTYNRYKNMSLLT